MDYEKKYKEALERARQFSEKPYLEDSAGIVEYIFPELKESEDKRIKKMLRDVISQWRTGNQAWCSDVKLIDATLAWLEKQGEQKSLDDITKEVTKDKDAAISFLKSTGIMNENGELADEYKIEQGEKKPAGEVEPKFKVKYAGSEYNVLEVKDIAGVTYYEIEDEPNHIDYILPDNCEIVGGYSIKENGSPYPTKPAVFSEQKPANKIELDDNGEPVLTPFEAELFSMMSEAWQDYSFGKEVNIAKIVKAHSIELLERADEQKPAWSEEDESWFKELELMALSFSDDDSYRREFFDWLKSLINRVQPQPEQEWSDEDERLFQIIIDILDREEHLGHISHTDLIACVRKLKSLRPYNRWKMSDEQMLAINTAIGIVGEYTLTGQCLEEVLEQLKAL